MMSFKHSTQVNTMKSVSNQNVTVVWCGIVLAMPSHGGKKKRLALTVWLSEFVADSAFDLATRVDSKDQLMRDYFVACCGLCS